MYIRQQAEPLSLTHHPLVQYILYSTRIIYREFKGLKGSYSSSQKPISELRSVICHMGSHSVTCHPTQVNVPRLNPSQTGRLSTYLPWRDKRLSWHGWLLIYRDGLPVRGQSLIRARVRATTLITHNVLTNRPRHKHTYLPGHSNNVPQVAETTPTLPLLISFPLFTLPFHSLSHSFASQI